MISDNIRLSIIVPCYNEEKNIPFIFKKFTSVIDRDDIEVILVNNGSTDNSAAVMKEFVDCCSFARLVSIDVNQGYGYGITTGLKAAQGEFISYTHADLQTDPEDVLKAFEIISKQKKPKICYVKGDRKGRPIFDQLFTIGMSFFESIYLQKKLWDINAQPNIFHRDFFNSIKENCPKDFSLDLYFLYMAKKKNLRVIRFNVVFPERLYGESSWNNEGLSSKWKFIKRTLNFSLKLKREL